MFAAPDYNNESQRAHPDQSFFRSAEANVVSGTKNTNTCRIATIAKSEMARPAHVARETFVLADGWLEANGELCGRDCLFPWISIEMPQSSSLDSGKSSLTPLP